MNSKEKFIKESYEKIKNILFEIPKSEINDIYTLSFWYYCEDDDLRFPTIEIGYNTNTQYENEKENTDDEREAKWNFAYWLEEGIDKIGGEEDDFLAKWFKDSPFYFSEEEMEDDECYKKYEQFEKEFIEIIIQLVRRLFDEKIISQIFGKDIPVIIHELEYYDKPINWTKKANASELIEEFLNFYDAE